VDNHKEILEKLSIRTISYFKDDLTLPCNNKPSYEILEVDSVEYQTRIAFISFKGALKGTVGISITENFALDIARAFVFGEMEEDELINLIPESAKEVLNVTVGNIIIDLDIVKQGKKVDISVPSSLVGPTVVEKKADGKMFISRIKYSSEDITLSYFT